MEYFENEQLKNEIEEIRSKLEKELERKNLSNQKIIDISQNLDKLIAEYMIKTSKIKND